MYWTITICACLFKNCIRNNRLIRQLDIRFVWLASWMIAWYSEVWESYSLFRLAWLGFRAWKVRFIFFLFGVLAGFVMTWTKAFRECTDQDLSVVIWHQFWVRNFALQSKYFQPCSNGFSFSMCSCMDICRKSYGTTVKIETVFSSSFWNQSCRWNENLQRVVPELSRSLGSWSRFYNTILVFASSSTGILKIRHGM